MRHLSFFNGTFHQFLSKIKMTCLETLFDLKLYVFKNFSKLTIFGILNELLSTQNVNVAGFVWDFFSVIFKHCAMMKIVLQFSKIDVFLLTFYFGCNVGFLSDISAHFSWYDFLSSPPSSCDWQNNEVNLIGNWPLKQILAILLQQNRRKNKLQSIRSRFNPQINLRTD